MAKEKDPPQIYVDQSGSYDPRIIDELVKRAEEQRQKSERLEEAILRLADAKTVDTNLVNAFDRLVVYLEPLEELKGLTPKRRSPGETESDYFQRMRDALKGVDVSFLTSVQADTRPTTYIGAIPTSSPQADRGPYQGKVAS